MKRTTPGDGTVQSTGAANTRKKAKRTPSSQQIRDGNADNSLKDGRLDVPGFVADRAYESGQLEASMDKSKKTGKKRAFQSPPRSLRRRTASHNVDRVPKKLRDRARMEMAADNTSGGNQGKKSKKPRGHSRVKVMAEERAHQRASNRKSDASGDFLTVEDDHTGVNEAATPPQGHIKFHKRQKNKNWLPTHVWHAKRAHMSTRWGFSIAQTPTEKCYRPTHRASVMEGAIAWDSSYFSTILLGGSFNRVAKALAAIGATQAARERYKRSNRVWEGLLTLDENEIIGPALIFWNKDYDDGNDKENEDRGASTDMAEKRTVLVRVHPDIFSTVFEILQRARDGVSDDLTIYDCRFSIGGIDITGPKSLLALRTVLNPDEPDPRKNDRWKDLATLINPSSLPESVVITLLVNDPRLYPPKSFKPSAARTPPDVIISNWPEYMSSSSSLFNRDGRLKSYKHQSSLKRINERRTDNDPTKPLPILPEDPKIPVVVMKRRDNSWTLLLPWGWVLPFWHNLMQVTNVRLGGLDQRHQLAYEVGRCHFPDDYFFTKAGIRQANETAAVRRSIWESKPSGKRVEYDSLKEIGDPFRPDWKLLLPHDSNGNNDEEQPAISPSTICPVRLRYKSSGTPSYAARIYDSDNREPIGFVTSGAFNLAMGFGFALGGILSSHLNGNPTNNIVSVRNVGERIFREAQWDKIELYEP